jgi:predicted N-acetyltransferase YhbS
MEVPVTVRQETAADHAAVFALIAQAFGRENESRLVEALRENKAVFLPELSRVAYSGDVLAGHILFTKIAIEHSAGTRTESLALAPVSVLPEWQHKGIGQLLVCEGLALAQQMGFPSVVVLGHATYYPKFGFKPAFHWNIKAPFEVKPDAFMAIELQEGSLSGKERVVVYPKEFYEV